MTKTDLECNLNGLSSLIAVVNAGGFSSAARRLGVPVNRLSRQIQRMEDELGVRLLIRTTRRLNLTPAGRALLEEAEPALQQIANIWRAVGAQSEEPSGHLRVAAPADFLSVLPAEKLAQFLEQHPAITLELILSDDPVDFISSGIDVAFRAGPIRDESVVARRLGFSRLIIVASPSWVDKHGKPRDVTSLPSYPCLASASKEGHTVWPLSGPKGDASIKLKAVLTVNGMGALIAAAETGLGAALVPERLAQKSINAGTLIHMLPKFYFDGGGFFAVYPSRRHPPASLRAFLDFAMRQAEAQIPEPGKS
jgi:DNA-binding transcriptional LysR family regulator